MKQAVMYGGGNIGGIVGSKSNSMGMYWMKNCSFTGKIEATGTQAELLASCPLYQTMWEAHISVKDDGEVA